MVAEVRAGEPLQCRCGLCNPDESPDRVASGHLGGFSDPLMDCKECHERFRADKLIEDFCEENGIAIEGSVDDGARKK